MKGKFFPNRSLASYVFCTFFSFFILNAVFALNLGHPVPTNACDPTIDFDETFLISQWDKLPHKCQEESMERVNEINALHPKRPWKYCDNHPVWTCLSYAASTVSDWWAIQLGWKLGSYKNFYNNQMENGFNPRPIEIQYLHRAERNPIEYPVLPHDPVTNGFDPVHIRGYARILTSTKNESLSDNIVQGETYQYKEGMYPFEGNYISVRRLVDCSTGDLELKLIKALHHFGIAYIKVENKEFLGMLYGSHAVSIIGYGKTKEGKTVFIYQDSYGEHPKTFDTPDGKSSYRCTPAGQIESFIVFPHKPVAKICLQGNNVSVQFFNSGAQPIQVRQVLFQNNLGKEEKAIQAGESFMIPGNAVKNNFLNVYVEAEYYMQDFEKGYWLKVPVK
ncbi:MAG: hypothetical protein HQM08_24510 [Candidatus Riflebacteria bacterium]|nr:hypothetical protein [Candidatus Riflebacteria bacterium]